jgi:2-iminobutanoate/2-iminopropanoate deaminase
MTANEKAKAPPVFPLSRYRVQGDTVYVSGQVPVRGGEVVSDNFEEQVRQTRENLRAAVTEAGSSLDRILKCNCYLRREGDMAEFNRIYREFFGANPLPARTTLIANPPNSRVLVEIDATAALAP